MITTAKNRNEILERILSRHGALYIDQGNPLNYCGLDDDVQIEEDRHTGTEIVHTTMEAPLLIDVQTANAMKVVRDALSESNKIKFDSLSWARAGKIAWGLIK